eukprot:TRINITY_DN22630_c0_g1_i5.p3 TRINITY_DN22630_c0_g1~~TRINITY_DN22630_c0_g1_i5.p3  ORF type:complete len:104 (+),score=23.29 TRINITY_DN22630_c0_g1_i5:145-456(+)
MLAGICRVPLTAIVLLFELTRDYNIVLPTIAAVGIAFWTCSVYPQRQDLQKQGSQEMNENQQMFLCLGEETLEEILNGQEVDEQLVNYRGEDVQKVTVKKVTK